MKRRSRIILALAAGAFIIAIGGVLILARLVSEPPLELYSQARGAVENARRESAEIYAAEVLATAESLLVSGELEISKFNARWYLFPSDFPARSKLSEAILNANLAVRMAGMEQSREEKLISESVNNLSRKIEVWERSLASDLNLMDCRKAFLRAKTESEVAEHLLKMGEFSQAKSSAEKAEKAIAILDDLYGKYEIHRNSSIDDWNRWVSNTLKGSRTSGKNAVIVDKSAHRLYLIAAGKIARSYSCDLGFNSGYNKKRLGDGATPEGLYQITNVMHTSKYYKALRLNYPNKSDKERFAANKRNGVIAENDRIGGLIEIHGHGGTGKDWTDGCIALSNNDMDDLMGRVRAGTPVTIVRKSQMSE